MFSKVLVRLLIVLWVGGLLGSPVNAQTDEHAACRQQTRQPHVWRALA